MDVVTLYQFELCPYCHKVKAGMDVKGIPYTKVEVNPMTKQELPSLPEGVPKKVPVVEIKGEHIYDSTTILEYLDKHFDTGARLLPKNEQHCAQTRKIEQWVDDDLSFVLPTVIYGRFSDAVRAAKIVAQTSNFGFVQNALVRGGGSLIMHQVSKRIMKKRGGTSPQQMLDDEMNKFETWLGDQSYVCGDELSLGDVATHGCLTCIRDFPAFEAIMSRPKVKAWYERVEASRIANTAAPSA